MTTFTIGCDPELFLVKKDGSPLSAHGAIPGTKKEPHKVDQGAVQVDGMALEFNTDPVTLSNTGFQNFNFKITSVISSLKQLVISSTGYKSSRFKIVPVQDFGEEIMAATPDEAKELGCDPDYCAYTKDPNPRPAGGVTFRTASGHIHVGWGADIPVNHPDHIDICCDFIKCLDAHVGLFMTIIETDPRRRQLYGKAGAFRPKPYGVEYRTPSNEWLINKDRRKMIYFLTQQATITMQINGGEIYKLFNTYSNTLFNSEEEFYTEVSRVINEGDKKTAFKLLLMRFYNLYDSAAYKSILMSEYNKAVGNRNA